MMFNGMLFGKEARNEVTKKVICSAASFNFSVFALLQSIYLHGGAININNNACNLYAA